MFPYIIVQGLVVCVFFLKSLSTKGMYGKAMSGHRNLRSARVHVYVYTTCL